MIGPEGQGGLEVAALAAADLPQAPAVAPAPAGPASRLEEALQDMAASWAGAPAPSRDVAGKQDSAEGPVRADTDVQLASEIPVGVAGNEGISQVGDAGGVEVGSLARLDGPWFFILAALGAVTVYGRRSRQARGSAASRDGADAQPTRSLFRLWGRHASRKASFGRHSPQAPHVATPRPNACPRPKHLSNP
jgi:hypothetical protein